MRGKLGNDELWAGTGADLLIGGLGADDLRANGGGDLLVAGHSSHDDNQAVLNSARTIWPSGLSYNFRGLLTRALFFRPGVTVFDDGAIDTLRGGSGRDLFFAELDGNDDDIRDLRSNELVIQMF